MRSNGSQCHLVSWYTDAGCRALSSEVNVGIGGSARSLDGICCPFERMASDAKRAALKEMRDRSHKNIPGVLLQREHGVKFENIVAEWPSNIRSLGVEWLRVACAHTLSAGRTSTHQQPVTNALQGNGESKCDRS